MTQESPAFELTPGVTHVQTLSGPESPLGRVAWSPDGTTIAAACKDGHAWVWDVTTGAVVAELDGNVGGMRAVAFDRAGALLATCGDHGPIRIWRVGDWDLVSELGAGDWYDVKFGQGTTLAAAGQPGLRRWDVTTGTQLDVPFAADEPLFGLGLDAEGGLAAAWSLRSVWTRVDGETVVVDIAETVRDGLAGAAVHPGGRQVAVAHARAVALIVDGAVRTRLEGHTGALRAIAYSADGRLLASKAANEVRVWDAAEETLLVTLPVTGYGRWTPGLAFHPRDDRIAVVGAPPGSPIYSRDDERSLRDSTDRQVHVFAVAPQRLQPTGVRYTSAKAVLVGDSGVGKTGLGWRLAHGEFKEQESTHGQQLWTLGDLGLTRKDGARCELVLWDLAGQQDYRLVHALFLDDADLALVLFDPTHDGEPLHGVEYWLQQLGDDRDVVLVAARADRGTARITDAEIEAFRVARGIERVVVTSARSGEGLEGVLDAVRTLIQWDALPATTTPETFKRIKDRVLALRNETAHRAVVTPDELRALLEPDAGTFSDEEMLTAVGLLANRGYVASLTTSAGEPRILLAPELLNNLAASIVLEARKNANSLGSLDEHRLMANDYRLAELDGLEPEDRDSLLDSAVSLFLTHSVCFRQTDPLSARVYLVFPELINLKKPAIDDEHPIEDADSYGVSGVVENVYASLVVLLGYTSVFARTNQWRDQAQYVVRGDRICGFKLDNALDGRLDLVLYFGTNVETGDRDLFRRLFESFLERPGLEIRRYPAVRCVNGHPINRAVVREQVDEGNMSVFCSRCGARVALDDAGSSAERAMAHTVQHEHRITDERAGLEQALYQLAHHVQMTALTCFISYAWGNAEHERWVEALANDLTKAGITVILDRWENARIGASVPRFVERVHSADRVIVVGTSDYRRKYDNGDPMRGFVAAAEGDLIGDRMLGSEAGKEAILPVLLEGDKTSFPALLQSRVHADFRDAGTYFTTMLALVRSLYAIDPRDPEVRALLNSDSGG